MAPRVVVVLVIVLGVSLCAAARVETQTASAPQDTVHALLEEVRALRATIEAMASAGVRGQLALGRLQLQEQRLNEAIAKLEGTRERLAQAQRDASEIQAQTAKLAAELKEVATVSTGYHREPSVDNVGLEEMLKMYRRELAARTVEIQQLTADEAALTGEVSVEQSRWLELNRRLDEIEQSLPRR